MGNADEEDLKDLLSVAKRKKTCALFCACCHGRREELYVAVGNGETQYCFAAV